jgi:8-oxo-dGTP diphosphatase
LFDADKMMGDDYLCSVKINCMPFTYQYPRLALTVDAVVFRKNGNKFEVLLIRRKNEPFKGKWALPGGFIDMGETLEAAVERELLEETGMSGIALQQLHAFSAIDRDPRGRTVSVIFWGIDTNNAGTRAGDDASETAWFRTDKLPPLAFDHLEAVLLAIKKISETNID